MQRREDLAHFILTLVVVLGLTLLMVCVDVQAQIAFMSNRDGSSEIYVMDTDGRNQRRLTNNHHNDWEPSWSPDGKRIVFSSRQVLLVANHHGNAPHDIYVMDADGENPKRLTEHPLYDISPSWSPDGKRIAFASNRGGPWGIFVMDTDGGNPQRLTNNPFDERDPSWSPDGKRIVFSARRKGHFRDGWGITYDIYVMDADGDNEQRLTENRFDDREPSWSPDGKRIAFASDRAGRLENFDIYVMDVNGSNEQRLTENGLNDWEPSWSPDGERIAFASSRIDFWLSDIYVMDADGSNERNITNEGQNTAPSWYTRTLPVAPTDKVLTIWGRLKRVDR